MCDYCGRIGDHHPRCPLYEPKETSFRCVICGDGIYPGDEYVKNIDDEYIHYECVSDFRWMINWLGGEVKTMEDDL